MMKINLNDNPRIFLICILFSFIAFIFCSSMLVKTLLESKDYLKTKATVIDVYRQYDQDGDFIYYVKLSFDYENKHFYTNQRVSFGFNKKEGKEISIYFNPKNPTQVRSNWWFRTYIITSILTFTFFIGMIIGYRQIKKKI